MKENPRPYNKKHKPIHTPPVENRTQESAQSLEYPIEVATSPILILPQTEEAFEERTVEEADHLQETNALQSLVKENKQRVNQLIDEMDPETAVVCTQAILMLMNGFQLVKTDQT